VTATTAKTILPASLCLLPRGSNKFPETFLRIHACKDRAEQFVDMPYRLAAAFFNFQQENEASESEMDFDIILVEGNDESFCKS
jgi:hypothetical protein